jgi:hypothetical protein
MDGHLSSLFQVCLLFRWYISWTDSSYCHDGHLLPGRTPISQIHLKSSWRVGSLWFLEVGQIRNHLNSRQSSGPWTSEAKQTLMSRLLWPNSRQKMVYLKSRKTQMSILCTPHKPIILSLQCVKKNEIWQLTGTFKFRTKDVSGYTYGGGNSSKLTQFNVKLIWHAFSSECMYALADQRYCPRP